MKFAITLLAGMLAVAVVSASISLAADKPAEQPKITGTIKSVNADSRSFVVVSQEEGKEPASTTFRCGSNAGERETEVLLNGKPADFDVIKAGRKVTVTFAKVGDERMALKVAVTTDAKTPERARE